METKTLHIVSLDVPFPPDYGAAIDIYYRCKALKDEGFDITLHCFEYGRGTTLDASDIASRVFYYPRKKALIDWFFREPFIVKTRASRELLGRLCKDDHPILFEGQHTTRYLDHPALFGRKMMVRIHNIEWQYYAHLAKRADSFLKRLFFRSESRKLKRHETVLKHADVLACLSQTDETYYRAQHQHVVYLPAGVSLETVVPDPKGYALLHGNLSVEENNEAALWVLNCLREKKFTMPLVISGKEPSEALKTAAKQQNVTLVANPDSSNMQQLICEASVHLLISFQHSGIKLKLLTALNSGAPCIATPEMVAGTDLGKFCSIVSTPEELVQALNNVQPLTEGEINERRSALEKEFGAEKVVEVMNNWLDSVILSVQET